MKIKMRPELALIKDIKPQRGPTAETVLGRVAGLVVLNLIE